MAKKLIDICKKHNVPFYICHRYEIAEQLLQFDKVEASFTIGRIEKNVVGVSARSLGNVNVEEIMSALGGGGHLTDAAAQLERIKMEEVKR